MFTALRRRRAHAGFTLLEVMITVAIVGILAAIALPSYSYFVTRSRITEATNELSLYRNRMEKFFLDNRSYLVAGACPLAAELTTYNAAPDHKFAMTCAATATTYTLTATGNGPMSGFVYTVNEQNVKVTTGVPAGWTSPSPNTCWAIRKDGTCT
jgi:type IV pilus assembly protein PilE